MHRRKKIVDYCLGRRREGYIGWICLFVLVVAFHNIKKMHLLQKNSCRI